MAALQTSTRLVAGLLDEHQADFFHPRIPCRLQYPRGASAGFAPDTAPTGEFGRNVVSHYPAFPATIPAVQLQLAPRSMPNVATHAVGTNQELDCLRETITQ